MQKSLYKEFSNRNSGTTKSLYKISIKGFTVLEVVVAIFIFGVISAALIKMIGTADKIHGRANKVMETVIIAQNEADRIRNAAAFKETSIDCTYIAIVNNQEFEVERRVVQPEYGEIEVNDRLQEIELLIKAKSSPDTIKFRMIQGFTW